MSTQFVRSMNVEAMQVEEEWLILNADQYTVTKLNEAGGICWALLKEPNTIDSLALELQKHYDITAEEAKEDVMTFLSQLSQLGLIEYAS
ncbi:PqqD family protein [Paenibacillus hamazuiensis]|uniref:PqqD family protein n=1 Tax=Paenibacillus hamazuiensis TaxID=2936508 RepID=UPI00200DB5AD|nr:PqqD family protein [Paenibacillus hamazuiensis]